jgi:hypothetical protein
LLPPDRYYVKREPLRLLAKSLRFTDPVSGVQRELGSRFVLDFPAASFEQLSEK